MSYNYTTAHEGPWAMADLDLKLIIRDVPDFP
jgi:hypothetical protein